MKDKKGKHTRREFLKRGAAALVYVPPAVATFLVSLQDAAWAQPPPCKAPTECPPAHHSFAHWPPGLEH